MTTPQESDHRKTLFLTCGCLTSLLSICLICAGLSSLILWPAVFGLEPALAELGLTAYDYESLRERITGEAAPTRTPTNTPSSTPTLTPTSTATFTPIPTFTPTPTPTETATVPPTDTPSRPTPLALATEEPTTTPTLGSTRRSATLIALSRPLATATASSSAAPPDPTTAVITMPTATRSPLAFQMAQLVDITGGDTITVLINGVRFQVKYLLASSPTPGQPLAAEALALNTGLLQGSKVVRLGQDGEIKTDQAGRLLRYVYAENFMLNEELIRRGLARVSINPADARYLKRFSVLQEEAQAFGLGLWTSPSQQAIATSPGADNETNASETSEINPVATATRTEPGSGGGMVPEKGELP